MDFDFHLNSTRSGTEVFVDLGEKSYFVGVVVDLGEEGAETWGGRFMAKAARPGMTGARKWNDDSAPLVRWLVRRWVPENAKDAGSIRPCMTEWPDLVAPENVGARLEVEMASYPMGVQ